MTRIVRNGLSLAAVVLLLGSSVWARPAAFPEIDPASGTAALMLLGGAIALIRGWRRN